MKDYGRVLIACPSSDRHWYVFDEWLRAIKEQDYDNFDILIVDTSEGTDYHDYLVSKGLRVIRYPWDPKENNVLQHLAFAREKYRKVAVDEGYDYLFNLDSDVILPRNGLSELLCCDKDQVCYVVHVFPKGVYQPPCVFKKGGFLMNQDDPKRNGLQYYSWSWVRKYKGRLKKVYGGGFGLLLIKRKVFLEVPFRTHPNFYNGEDLWYYAEADDKGFEAWCLVKRIKHDNTSWDGIVKTEVKRNKIYFAYGYEDAQKVVMLDAN